MRHATNTRPKTPTVAQHMALPSLWRFALATSAGVLAAGSAGFAFAQAAPIFSAAKLAPHRAIYEMKLGDSRSGSGVTDLSGRMVFEITGSVCEGYTQNMRFVMETSNRDGASSTTDMRSSSWEDGAAGRYRFTVSNYRDQEQTDSTSGNALRSAVGSAASGKTSDKGGDKPADKAGEKTAASGGEVKVELTKPQANTFNLPGKVVFPVQHSRMLIDAAVAGQSLLDADLYDGSEKGEKVYATTAVIGKPVKAAPVSIAAKVKNADKLSGLASWPVSISYFDKSKEKEDSLPVYEIAFRYFTNGVSENLVIDYGDFSIMGALKEIEFYEMPKCDGEKK
jgi:EipB-like